MFNKILIANRGEIACRVMETATRMGVGTVAVFSGADAASKHVAMADEAVHIGGSTPAESYLKGDVIIQAALETGAEAIHPGYGFLSENPDFVAAVQAAGLVFIGPSADAIRAMGLKDAAKVLMEKAGVPVVPGYHGDNQDPEHLSGAADAIGYPVLIKAVAGGGGKGMRKVDTPAEFMDALNSARSEAQTAFGNDAVLVEKFVEKPRHIEIQVFGDGKSAVHLVERDCSLQRRHQKVIEEAPAPGMTAEMRAAMGQAGVQAAKAIGYKGAGTVEFIVDASDGLRADRFWFMEMNTRLQVEHPVTEAITGVDLVEWQLRVASGEPLPTEQSGLSINGHAFEARIYAEDVPAGFLPATGTLHHLDFPAAARADSGVRPGDSISPYYDPMIAKLIVHGETRTIALKKLSHALQHTEVAGLVTNLAFLSSLAKHKDFVAGDVDTGLIERDAEILTQESHLPDEMVALASLAIAGLAEKATWDQGFNLWQPLSYTAMFKSNGSAYQSIIQVLGNQRFRVELSGGSFDLEHHAGTWWINGQSTKARIRCFSQSVSIFGKQSWHFQRIDPLQRDGGGPEAGNVVLAPMPGLVKDIFVRSEDPVGLGDRLAVLEAMKMEHSLAAPRAGRVAEILVQPGSQVEAGAALIRLEEGVEEKS